MYVYVHICTCTCTCVCVYLCAYVVHMIIIICLYSYLSIIPAELLSAHEVGGDSEMTYYLLDAHRQVRIT